MKKRLVSAAMALALCVTPVTSSNAMPAKPVQAYQGGSISVKAPSIIEWGKAFTVTGKLPKGKWQKRCSFDAVEYGFMQTAKNVQADTVFSTMKNGVCTAKLKVYWNGKSAHIIIGVFAGNSKVLAFTDRYEYQGLWDVTGFKP